MYRKGCAPRQSLCWRLIGPERGLRWNAAHWMGAAHSLAKLGPQWAEFSAVCLESVPSVVCIGVIRLRPAFRPALAGGWPTLPDVGHLKLDVGHLTPGFDQVLKVVGRIRADACRVLPEIGRFGAIAADWSRLRPILGKAGGCSTPCSTCWAIVDAPLERIVVPLSFVARPCNRHLRSWMLLCCVGS